MKTPTLPPPTLAIRRALVNRELWVAYQPIVDLSARRIFAYEALARSKAPEFKNPLELFAAAVEHALTAELGQVLRQMSIDGCPDFPLFINIHPSELNEHRIIQPSDPLYQHVLLTAEKKFWRCVESGEPPRLFGAEPPRPRIEAIRIVDMSASNAWAEFSGVFRRTREAYLEHETAKTELKGLMPEDAKEATGHGVRAKRSKSGAVSFDVLSMEGSHAPVQ